MSIQLRPSTVIKEKELKTSNSRIKETKKIPVKEKIVIEETPQPQPVVQEKVPVVNDPPNPNEDKDFVEAPEEKVATPVISTEPPKETNFSNQVENSVLGGQADEIQDYKKQIHPDDIRKNILEVDFGLGLLYNDSKSDFSYRRYSSLSQKIELGGKIWLTPFFGLNGSYMTTTGGEVRGRAMDFRVPMIHDWTSFGISFRRFYGLSRRAPALEFGINAIEHRTTVPADSADRTRLKTSGVELSLKTLLPETPRYSWTLGIRYAPRASHNEGSTALKIDSGSKSETNLLGISVGGETKFTRENQLYWNLDYILEKNQFRGKAKPVDPISGVRPENVSITNSFLMFTFGYRLGN